MRGVGAGARPQALAVGIVEGNASDGDEGQCEAGGEHLCDCLLRRKRCLDRDGIVGLLDLADALKHGRSPAVDSAPLAGRSVALIFQKPSLRTRVSFEVGVGRLGGQPIVLSGKEVGLGSRETVADVARTLERYVDAIVARVFDHQVLVDLADAVSIPVVNALSDAEHPCQALADLQVLREHLGSLSGKQLVFVGDGNNVAASLLLAGASVGMHVRVVCPARYAPDAGILARAQALGERTGARIEVSHDPETAAVGADARYTDVWASMAQEDEAGLRRPGWGPVRNAPLLQGSTRSSSSLQRRAPAYARSRAGDKGPFHVTVRVLSCPAPCGWAAIVARRKRPGGPASPASEHPSPSGCPMSSIHARRFSRWLHFVLAFAACWLAGRTALATVVPGGNVVNQTWSPAGNPYIVQGDITIPAGAFLTVQAGTIVLVASTDSQASGSDATRVEVIVKGTLKVNGTQASPVSFSAQGGAGTTAWYGIEVDPAATAANLTYATLRNAAFAVTSAAPGALFAATNVTITSCNYGFTINHGTPTLTSVSVTGGQGGRHGGRSGAPEVLTTTFLNPASGRNLYPPSGTGPRSASQSSAKPSQRRPTSWRAAHTLS